MKIIILIGTVCLAGFLWGKSDGLQVGDQAPDFKLPDQDSIYHTLSDYRGQVVIVYFYPKDGTPG